MQHDEETKIVAEVQGKGVQQGTLLIHPWSKGEAKRKGVFWGLGVWGLGLLTLPIPGVHFVAPPACLIAGPLVALGIYRLHSGVKEVRQSTVLCPACQQDLGIRTFKVQWPMTVVCPHCQAVNQVSLLD